jgi:hypothetical protein
LAQGEDPVDEEERTAYVNKIVGAERALIQVVRAELGTD